LAFCIAFKVDKSVSPEKLVKVEKGAIARPVAATGKIEPLSKVEIKSKAILSAAGRKTSRDRISSAGIRAVNHEYELIRGMCMGEGRFLNAEDLAAMRRVVVLGYDLKKKLYSRSPAISEDFFIR